MDNYMDLQRKHMYYALRWQIFLFIVIVFFISLLTVLCLHNCEGILLCNHRRRHMGRRAQNLPSIPTASSKGLEPSVVKTIPTIVYTTTKAAHFPPLECAICLSEFENDQKARVLPMCNHTFHVDCIDMWFYSHSNCPLCRAPVQADVPVNPPKTLEQTIIPVAETAGSEPPREDFEMDSSFATAAASSSSSSSSSPSSLKMESCPRKTLELTGILVEVPTGEDRLTGDADEDLGNRIPGVTRICTI